MDLDLTNDQELLRETTERFIEANFALAKVREVANGGSGPGTEYWRQAAELGWFAGLATEDLGGGSVSGNGLLDAAIFAEERGRALQPGAFAGTNAVVAALARSGTEEQRTKILPRIISGEATALWALGDRSGDWSSGAGVSCSQAEGGYRLTGTKGLVASTDDAEWVLVSVEGPDGPTQFLVPTTSPGLSVEMLEGLDLSRRLCEVSFDGVTAETSQLVGAAGLADQDIEYQFEVALVLAVAESVGAMDYLFALTLDYAKDRVAFGRPIGSFQAVKHQLADTSLLLEESKAVAVAAARAVQRQDADAGSVASAAKAFVGDSGIDLAQACWQTFGGIGYTWEHDLHLFLRRLTTDASLFGAPSWHRERICRLNGI